MTWQQSIAPHRRKASTRLHEAAQNLEWAQDFNAGFGHAEPAANWLRDAYDEFDDAMAYAQEWCVASEWIKREKERMA